MILNYNLINQKYKGNGGGKLSSSDCTNLNKILDSLDINSNDTYFIRNFIIFPGEEKVDEILNDDTPSIEIFEEYSGLTINLSEEMYNDLVTYQRTPTGVNIQVSPLLGTGRFDINYDNEVMQDPTLTEQDILTINGMEPIKLGYKPQEELSYTEYLDEVFIIIKKGIPYQQYTYTFR